MEKLIKIGEIQTSDPTTTKQICKILEDNGFAIAYDEEYPSFAHVLRIVK